METKNRMKFRFLVITTRRMALMTQLDFARVMGVATNTVYKWESGACVPRADKFMELMNFRKRLIRAQRGRGLYASEITVPAAPRNG